MSLCSRALASLSLSFALLVVAVVGGCDHPPVPPEPPTPPIDPAPQPRFGPTIVSEAPTPALTGGTMLALSDGEHLVISDPDRDRVYVVAEADWSVRASIPLGAADEPGRAAEDGAGRVHVILRRGGAIATIDVAAGRLVSRREICAAPRGIAWERARDLVHVACADGRLLTLAPGDGTVVREVQLDDDLRDVVSDGTHLFVSRFRAAEVLVLDEKGTLLTSVRPPAFSHPLIRNGALFEPRVAWRMIARPGGGVMLVHQRMVTGPVVPTEPTAPTEPPPTLPPGAYGGTGANGLPSDCGSIVHTVATTITVSENRIGAIAKIASSPIVPSAVLPIDAAFDGKRLTIVAPANAHLDPSAGLFVPPQVFAIRYDEPGLHDGSFACVDGSRVGLTVADHRGVELTAIALVGDRLVAQSREPAAVVTVDDYSGRHPLPLILSEESRADTGHAVFHANAGVGVACASCHPEGGEDGHTWQLAGALPRRTQSLLGGVSGTEPFHWGGEVPDFTHLMQDVFVNRMGGPSLTAPQVFAAVRWIDRLPLPMASRSVDDGAIARGRALFESRGVGCARCHAGARLTTGGSAWVSTGGTFQIPSLRGVALRAPYLHDGRAATLSDVLRNPKHGGAATLPVADRADLIAYLRSL
jgi:mono/diheme cytochrome c family protein